MLKGESVLASILPDIQVTAPETVVEARMQDDADADLQDSEEVEDLPGMRPEEEDAMAAEEERNDTESDDAVDEVETPNSTNGEPAHDPNGRMPGQLPTEATASHRDYHTVKRIAKEKIAALIGMDVLITTKKKGGR